VQTIKGIYRNGRIELSEPPKEVEEARVIVTFLDTAADASGQQRIAGTIEILDEDLEAASLEIRRQFLDALEKSGEEIQR
jgi:hypothetical protein